MPSANSRQLWTQKKKKNSELFQKNFQDLWIYLAKYFWSLLNYPNLISQQC